jgi:hypothetical protein
MCFHEIKQKKAKNFLKRPEVEKKRNLKNPHRVLSNLKMDKIKSSAPPKTS